MNNLDVRMLEFFVRGVDGLSLTLDDMKVIQELTPAEDMPFYPPRGLFDGLDPADSPVSTDLKMISSSCMVETIIKSRQQGKTFFGIELYEVEKPLMTRWRNTIVYHPALESEMWRQVEEWMAAVMRA